MHGEKTLIFHYTFDKGDELAKLTRSLTTCFVNSWKDASLKLVHNTNTGLKIVVSVFEKLNEKEIKYYIQQNIDRPFFTWIFFENMAGTGLILLVQAV